MSAGGRDTDPLISFRMTIRKFKLNSNRRYFHAANIHYSTSHVPEIVMNTTAICHIHATKINTSIFLWKLAFTALKLHDKHSVSPLVSTDNNAIPLTDSGNLLPTKQKK